MIRVTISNSSCDDFEDKTICWDDMIEECSAEWDDVLNWDSVETREVV